MCTNHCHRVFTQLQLANISIKKINTSPSVSQGGDIAVLYGRGVIWCVCIVGSYVLSSYQRSKFSLGGGVAGAKLVFI
jgi:hypothetical protein